MPWRSQIDQRLQEQHRLIVQLIGQQQRPAPAPAGPLPDPGQAR